MHPEDNTTRSDDTKVNPSRNRLGLERSVEI